MQADPRSPEHGQYGFLQDLVRHVAYETLSKRERRARHLAAAAHLSAAFAATRTRSSRSSPRTTSPPTRPHPTPTTRPRSSARRGRCSCGPASAPASLAAAAEARRYFEQAARARGRPVRARSAPRTARARWPSRAGDPEAARRAVRGVDRAATRSTGDTHAAARVLATARRESTSSPSGATRPWRGWSAPSPSSSDDEPDEDLATLAARLGARLLVRRPTSSVRPSAPNSRSTSPRRSATRRRSRSRCAPRRPSLKSRGHHEEALRSLQHALADRARARPVDEASTCYFILSDRCFRRDRVRRRARDTSTRRSHSRGRSATGRTSGLCSPSGPTRCACWAAGTKRRHGDEFTQEQIDSGGMVLSLLESAVAIRIERGELDGARSMFSMSRRLEDSTDVQDLSCYLGSRRLCAAPKGDSHDALATASDHRGEPHTRDPGAVDEAGIVEAAEAASRSAIRRNSRSYSRSSTACRPERGRRSSTPRRSASERASSGDPSGFEAAAAPLSRARASLLAGSHAARARRADRRRVVAAEAREIFERLGSDSHGSNGPAPSPAPRRQPVPASS